MAHETRQIHRTCEQVRAAAPARRLCLFGAAPDTGNLGVSALCHAVLRGVADRAADAVVTVFDHGRGVRYDHLDLDDAPFTFRRCGAVRSRRVWRDECLWRIRAASWLGGGGNPAAATIRRADFVLDASGGDSFSDIYGPGRFRAVALPKLIALEQGCPLILLPQTYGPFRDRGARRLAAGIVRRATMAWARDRASFAVLRELLGKDFHPDRHRCGVDLAFALPSLEPICAGRIGGGAGSTWTSRREAAPLVGLNVSGLLYNDPDAASRYGLRADYRLAVERLLARLLDESDTHVLMVPHVQKPTGHVECDLDACRAAVASCGAAATGRVTIAGPFAGPSEAKACIGRCTWFCGTRLHATIAAVSGGVPAAAIAYSDKTPGVFESCGLRSHVADARRETTDDLVQRLWRSWSRRDATRPLLAARIPEVIRSATAPLDLLLGKAPAAPVLVQLNDDRRAA